jgi:hypothetical protein
VLYGNQGIAPDEKPIPKRCYSGQIAYVATRAQPPLGEIPYNERHGKLALVLTESGSMSSSIIIETRFFPFTLHFFAITRQLNPPLKAEDELITSNRYLSFGRGSPISISIVRIS